jgi:hypothetical protein
MRSRILVEMLAVTQILTQNMVYESEVITAVVMNVAIFWDTKDYTALCPRRWQH